MEIPGTRYQVQGGSIIAPDGKPITQQDFLQKVESKEVSLTADSLRVLGQQFGPDLEKSLSKASGMTVSPKELSNHMSSTEAIVGDIYSLMELLAKVSMDQKKQANEMKQHETDMQIAQLNKAADDALAAARVRMIAGVISGVANIASGALGAVGAGKSLNALSKPPTINGTQLTGDALKTFTDATMQSHSSFGKIFEATAQITHSAMELGAAGHDKDAKTAEANARMLESMASASRDLAESLRDMNAKVREVVRDMHAATNQAMATIIR